MGPLNMDISPSYVLKRLHRIQNTIRRQLSIRLQAALVVPRHHNPYTTHLPILIGLAKLVKIRRVIEFGCGTYSTLTFLNRDCFPDLDTLHSFENDKLWAEEIGRAIQGDNRSTLTFFDQPMSLIAKSTNLERADLIFIDDSQNPADRARTIEYVVNEYKGDGIVVIHDYEFHMYQEASATAPRRFRFKALNPNTGVIWFKSNILERKDLIRLDKDIRQRAAIISPNDIAGWTRLLDQRYPT